MGEHSEELVGTRRTPSDDLVEGGLVKAGDAVFLSDRVVNSGAGCGEAQDDQAADTRGDGKECVRREVALERSQRSKARTGAGRCHVWADPCSDRGVSRRY